MKLSDLIEIDKEKMQEIIDSVGKIADGVVWVNAEDRLPTKTGRYSVIIRNGSMSPDMITRTVLGRMTLTGFSFVVGDWQTVTHWQEFL